ASASLAPARADDTLELARQPAWTALRSAGAIKKTSETAPLLHARRPPPLPPAVRSRGRHVERGRGSSDRLSTRDREHEPLAPGESELGVTVKAHLALLPADVWADAQPGRRAGSPPHPFTTCIGRTTSSLRARGPDPRQGGDAPPSGGRRRLRGRP